MFDPTYTISPKLLNQVKQIALLVHELNRVALPTVVLTELQQITRSRSAWASTTIEGNRLSLTEVRKLLKNRPNQITHSEREVWNYNSELQRLDSLPADVQLDESQLLAIHRGVADGLMPAHHTGQWRRDPVIIQNPQTQAVVYLPPDHNDVPSLMHDLLTFVQTQQQQLDPVILAGLFHRQFVIVHPFMDGNGRTARLATQYLMRQLGLRLSSLLSLENQYQNDVTRYFQTVGLIGNYYDVGVDPDFTAWLTHFAQGVLNELEKVQKTVLRHQTIDTRLKRHERLVLEYIDRYGLITDREYAAFTDRAKATRAKDFRRLIELGHIVRQGVGRATHYVRAENAS